MITNKKTLASAAFILLVSTSPAYALGGVDGEVIASWWGNSFDGDIFENDEDSGAIALTGEIWLGDSWGLRGARYESDIDDPLLENEDRTQIEIRRRIVSLSDNNFFAFGLGAENIELVNGESSTGVRVSAEARLAVTPISYLYGSAAYLPAMGDAGNFEDLTGTEFEVGISLTPFPFVSLKAGYLIMDLDYTNGITGLDRGLTTEGFLIGAGIHW